MIIGVPKEIKDKEHRIAITPGGVESLVAHGHEVYVEENGGLGSGISNEALTKAGAKLLPKEDVWKKAEMIIKVKEPLEEEYEYFQDGQILFTFLHLAGVPKSLTLALMEKGVVAIAYETIEDPQGGLPLLNPMSEVAGRLAPQMGIKYLEKHNGGKGVLLGGVPGVAPAKVAVIGGGCVGINSAKMALGLGADVTILEINHKQLQYLDDIFRGQVKTVMSNPLNIYNSVVESDMVVGGVLLPGAKAPHLVTEEMIKEMEDGSVVVDVAIDQGGCMETAKPTSHSDPVYTVHDVIHYCVTNMPGAVPRTSTYALTNCTLPYAVRLANLGYKKAIHQDPGLAKGVNVLNGKVTYKAVAEALDLEYYPIS